MTKKRLSKKIRFLTTRYVNLITDRRITDAERVLENIKVELNPTQWAKGYYNALEGIFITLKSKDDRYLFISRINTENKKRLNKIQKDFTIESKNPLQDEFDQGYYAAWVEYIQIVKLRDALNPLNGYLPNQ